MASVEQGWIRTVIRCALKLQEAPNEIKNNIRVVTAAVTGESPAALQYASNDLKNNEQLVTAAVTQYGMALLHASEEIRTISGL